MDTSKPAFPVSIPGCGDNGWHGMSLRDWFAGQALPPCIATVINIEAAGASLKKDAPVCAAEMAYQIADAMLAARSPQESGRD